jgi:hypothetical protein
VYPNIFVFVLENYKGVKESRGRPGVSQGVPGCLGSQIFMTFSLKGGEVLPPGVFLLLIFTRGRVDPRAMERLERIYH